jgi:hypothetical protein
MANASKDQNSVSSIIGVSSVDGKTPVKVYADPTTHRLLVDLPGSSGIVIDSTTITGGSDTNILYDKNGVVGEYTITGTGTVVAMQTSPTFTGIILDGTSTGSLTHNGTIEYLDPNMRFSLPSTESYTWYNQGRGTNLLMKMDGSTGLLNLPALTASEIVATDSSENLVSLSTSTYPSLTELSYVKGVTSAIQTQIDAKGTGTVTAVSVASANGFAGSSSGGATPALTLTTTITGVLKGNGTAISAATAGSDYAVGSTGLSGGQTIAGGTLTTQNLTLRANAADTTTGAVAITTSTASTTTTTGALTVAGGLGVAGAINALSVTATGVMQSGANSGTGGQLTLNGSTSGSVALKVSATAGTGTVFQLPADNGTNNYVLKTDGSGVTSWVAQSGGGITIGTTTITSGSNTKVLYDNSGVVGEYTISGSGNVAMTTSPSFTTPTLGVASATTINKVTITAPATGSTLTIADGKTLTASNTMTLAAGADSQTWTFPSTSDTVACLGTAQTFTATQTQKAIIFTNNAIAASGNAATVPITYRLNTVTNNSAATLTITMTTTSATDGQMTIVRVLDASAASQTLAWVNTENSTVAVPTTTNGSTTLFLTVGFMFNGGTSLWRCISVA